MPVMYVPRVGGGTLLLNLTPPPASTVATVVTVATFRDGEVQATFRDGGTQATFRDGVVQAGERG